MKQVNGVEVDLASFCVQLGGVTLGLLQASGTLTIPRFYYPNGKPLSEEVQAGIQAKVNALLQVYAGGLTVPALKTLLKEVCACHLKEFVDCHAYFSACLLVQVLGLPQVLAYPLFYKLVAPNAQAVSSEAFNTWCTRCNVLQVAIPLAAPWQILSRRGRVYHMAVMIVATQVDPVVRLYEILRRDGADCVTQDDLRNMLTGILLAHPGLEFLQETPEFQERWAL